MEKKKQTKRIGMLGENIACRYIDTKGLKVFTRNYRKAWGEIDIIAWKGPKTYFIEVKSVSCENIEDIDPDGYRPEENVHPKKMQRLARTIQTFIAENEVDDWQFDVVTVFIQEKGKLAKVERIENVIL